MLGEQLKQINDLALWDFETHHTAPGTLLVLGSTDFTYSHYLELEFLNVTFCDLPPQFSHAELRLGRDSTEEEMTIWIHAESWDTVGMKDYEVRAGSLEVRIGRVYYYERENLQPGERIASRRT